MPPALALIIWKKYDLTLCVWNGYALALVLRKLAYHGRSCPDAIYLDTLCQPVRVMRYPSSSSTYTHGLPRTSQCERHVGCSAPQANALTLVLKKNIGRLEELRPGTRHPEGTCHGRHRPDATCHDIRRLEEICPDTRHPEGIYRGRQSPDATCRDIRRLEEICADSLPLEGKVPGLSSSGMHMPWQAVSGCHIP